MLLLKPIQHVFVQLSTSLNELTDDEYIMPSKILSCASIGQHVRHIIELYQCLQTGYKTGIVNYENRKRDHAIETDRELAMSLLTGIFDTLVQPNKNLVLEIADFNDNLQTISIPSNYFRELSYNLEHSIHHMALIRVGINEVSNVNLPVDFGVAYSTLKFREQCAQ